MSCNEVLLRFYEANTIDRHEETVSRRASSYGTIEKSALFTSSVDVTATPTRFPEESCVI